MTATSDTGYQLVSAVFLRLLGVIYLIAFASLGLQVEGLAGSQGILPFSDQLAAIADRSGMERFFKVPTLFWFNAGDSALTGAAIGGCIASVLIILQRWSRPALIAAFILYLSLYQACQPFLNFQWDGLLLETGFLAIFLTPHSRVIVLLFRWLLFKLRFMSGLAKLASGDPAWSGLTALNTYFEVQPLPNPLSWYAHQLPEWLLKTGTAGTLAVELLVPLMMFLPRRWRFTAAWLTIFWQVLIILTSNHNWINLLTIILCLFLFDDRALSRVLSPGLRKTLGWRNLAIKYAGPAGRLATGLLAAGILLISGVHFWELDKMQRIPGLLGKATTYVEAFRVTNKYHVFPTMTSERIELEVSGSRDGMQWETYRFKYKPGALGQRPKLAMPYQPRLDWQMWFVTLHPRHLPWFEEFLYALLDNSPSVSALLEYNPFPDAAPRYIRVLAYRYTFTDPEQRAQSGNWWQREALGPFTPLPWVERNRAEPADTQGRSD